MISHLHSFKPRLNLLDPRLTVEQFRFAVSSMRSRINQRDLKVVDEILQFREEEDRALSKISGLLPRLTDGEEIKEYNMLIIIIGVGAKLLFANWPLEPCNAVGADVPCDYCNMGPWSPAPSIIKQDVSYPVDEAVKAALAACNDNDGLSTYRTPQATQLVTCIIMNPHLPTFQANLKYRFQIQWQEFRPSGQPM